MWAESTVLGRCFSAVTGPSCVTHQIRIYSVLVDPYGLTATTAVSSLEGWCREVTVTHSPGFTVFIAEKLLSGTFTRIVMY